VTAAGTITWRQLWLETTAALGGSPGAATEARWLCQEASGQSGAEWVVGLEEPASARMVAHLDAMVARRRAGEPVQYVLGSWGFRRLELMVDRRVIIPRPETEQVVEAALAEARSMPRPIVAADLGTGSGAIALALADELPVTGVEIWATEASPDALDVARANLAGLGRAGSKVRLAHGDWFEALPGELRGRLDLVVSNPPYVAEDDELDDSVREWEPVASLLGGPDGLDAVRRIVAEAPEWLRPGGALVLEIGADQGERASKLADEAGLLDVSVRPDLAGRDRVLLAHRP
jgi:release factor glutamine methyltransferase